MTACNETDKLITQDLLICEIEIFYNHTVLELAIKAETHEFVCLTPFQNLLTDVWFVLNFKKFKLFNYLFF